VVAVSVPMSLYACLQRGGIDPFAAQESTLVRPVSTVGNAAFFGAFLAVAIVAAFGLMLDAGRRWWWWAPIVVIDLVALVLTDSRGAWLGVVAGLLFVGWRSARVGAWRPVVVAGAALTTVVLILSVVVPGVALRAASIVHVGDGTAGARLVLDGVGVRAVAQRPLLGWGPDMSRAALHAHIPSDFEVKYLDARIEDRVHNVFLDIAVWGGLVGLACFVWFLVALVRNVRRRPLDPTAAIVVGACVAFGVHLLFNFPVPEIDMVIWLLLGSVVSSARRLPPAPAGAVAPAVVLGVALMTPSLVGSLTADRQVRIGVDREQAHDTPGALTAYRDAMSQSGNGAVYSEITTRALLRAHQPALAVDTARRLVAADTSDPYARELLASALNSTALSTDNTADAVEAEAITRHLLSRYPFDGSMHLELGNALAAQHHIPEAEAEFLRASELVPSRSDVWRNLAIVAELQHDPAAERYWRISLWLNPTDATARAALDRIHATG
jgi:O-antigen ligase/Flp pilus assembly protein TadD